MRSCCLLCCKLLRWEDGDARAIAANEISTGVRDSARISVHVGMSYQALSRRSRDVCLAAIDRDGEGICRDRESSRLFVIVAGTAALGRLVVGCNDIMASTVKRL